VLHHVAVRGQVRRQHRQPGGHGLKHDLRATLVVAAQGDQAAGLRKPGLQQLGRVRGAVVVHPRGQCKLLLHRAKQVQLALLAKQAFAPAKQIANLVFGEPCNRQPMARVVCRRRAHHVKPGLVNAKCNRTDFGQVAESLLQRGLHPCGVGRQNGAALAQHRPQQRLHAGQAQQGKVGAQHRD